MKTNPTLGVSGTQLSFQAVTSDATAAKNSQLPSNCELAISDTLETSDREADGRQDYKSIQRTDTALDTSDETPDRLDLIG